jgi:cytochrome c biogenesis protein CcmG/thiol:disulfide interchange protein DsbE
VPVSEQEPAPAAPDERPQRRREYSGAGSTLGVAALVIIAVGAAIWWFELRGSDSPGVDTEYGIVELADADNPTGESPAAREGRAAPNFRLATLEGGEAFLTDYRGQYILLNFWADWCQPCRGEAPDLQRFYEQQSPSGRFTILGVNQQEPRDTASGFVDDFTITYPILLDSDGEVSIAYRVPGPPLSMLINPSGVIERIYYGVLDEEQLAALADEYLTATAATDGR